MKKKPGFKLAKNELSVNKDDNMESFLLFTKKMKKRGK